MTRILALDTSTDACSVALATDSGVDALFELAARSHTQRLLPMVDQLLEQNNCSLADLDAIAFGRGPGSFTGLRICLGVVQGLAFARRLPVIPVSTLAAMAAGYFRSEGSARAGAAGDQPLLVTLDARMSEVYWGLFQPGQGVAPKALSEEQVSTPEEVVRQLRESDVGGGIAGVGQGWHYPELRALAPETVIQEWYPKAEDVARIALEAHDRGEGLAAHQAQPVYLRDTVSWQKRTRIRS